MRWLEIAGVITGLIYLWLEYRADIRLWVAGIIMPAIYIPVYYTSGFYADAGVNVCYLLAGLYGWMFWRGRRSRDNAAGTSGGANHSRLPISRTPRRMWLPMFLIFIAIFAALALLLTRFTDSTVPYGDGFTTALSIVALWMLSRKYVEQWLIWVAVDAVCSGLYIYKGLHPTAGLYALYAVIAVFGYVKWKKGLATNT
ncbi:MAG: nicotinamide riboside transporter PnuC [Rikenellaceae bacterium]|jgi:nicotinamide mononucleotide transporter|nr:nicotinamide riboside transporter PnuC [Rikenellaceae bacterium]